MGIIEYFAGEWHVIGQAPATFLIATVLVAGLVYAAASWRFGGIIESQRAQIELLARKVEAQPGGAGAEKRRAIINSLGEYLSRGTALMTAARNFDKPPPLDEANRWVNELADYLEANLGAAYVARVNDGGSAPVGYADQRHREHNDVYNGVRVRVYHLQEFLKELARA